MPPASSPLSSAPDDDELADMFSEAPYRAAASAITKPSRVVVSARGDSPDPLGFETDDVSAGLVELTEPPPEFLFDRDHAKPVPPPASTQHLRRQHSTPPSPETVSAIAAAVTAAQRYERSLRPRKPIQEHPYMIESAQYNKALKARGIKPVRMLEEAHARSRNKTPEDDSQEQEFQEESQNTVSEHQEENVVSTTTEYLKQSSQRFTRDQCHEPVHRLRTSRERRGERWVAVFETAVDCPDVILSSEETSVIPTDVVTEVDE
ncbi:hypothetical protein VD0002_g5869 [Verticillium dahliae]|nr:hypothetical protein BJF96_g6252 [Verticillium dahliae]PNH62105.1 hypothetical protein VD0002_g5869 [Verticillium dahliae]